MAVGIGLEGRNHLYGRSDLSPHFRKIVAECIEIDFNEVAFFYNGKRAAQSSFGHDLANRNAELQRSWFLLVIANHWEPGLPPVEQYLRNVGRRWLIRPLYQGLAPTDWGRAYANRIYREARPGYHSLTQGSIDRILEWSE